MPTQRDLSIRRGETFSLAVRWESDLWMYSPITAISKTAPVRITHAGAASPIPDGWEVAVVDAQCRCRARAALCWAFPALLAAG